MLAGGKTAVIAGDRPTGAHTQFEKDFEVPEVITFVSAGSGATPSVLEGAVGETMELRAVPISGIDFLAQLPDETQGEFHWASGIESGSVELRDVSQRVDLQPGEKLILDGLEGELVLVRAGDKITTVARGVVDEILLDNGISARNLKPSRLRYLFSRKPEEVYWGAVVVLFGWLWAFQKRFFS